MNIAVLSGKGGAGKTLVAVNLAAIAGEATYVDCDVEAPNGRLFLQPQNVREIPAETLFPAFDETRCVGCRKCVSFCRFHALAYVKGKPKVFAEVCHACGGCTLVCPVGAISETKRQVGAVSVGTYGPVRVVTGVLSEGEASAVPVVRAALQAKRAGETAIIDCPPGSGCSVTESVEGADYCVLVAEPTAFGVHNFKMVHELVCLLDKPCGVVINKAEGAYPKLEAFCVGMEVPILCRIPYSTKLARLCAEGKVAVEHDADLRHTFAELLKAIRREAAR